MSLPSNFNPNMELDATLEVWTVELQLPGDSVVTKLVSQGGGSKFNPGAKYASLEYDGKFAEIAGHKRPTGWDPKVTGKFTGFSDAMLQAIEPGAGVATAGTILTITPPQAGILIPASSYCTNVSLYGLRGDGKIVRVRYRDFGEIMYTIAAPDHKQGELDLTITAMLNKDRVGFDPRDCPFVVQVLTAADYGAGS